MRLLFIIIPTFSLLSTALPFFPCASATDELQIRNKLAIYSVALDTKNLDLLDEVFTADAAVTYPLDPPNDKINGLPALKQVLEDQLRGVVTQQALSTLVVECGPHRAPNSTTYLSATYLGQGDLVGQTIQFYGVFEDEWTHAEGQWKSKTRTLTFLENGVVGNTSIIPTLT
ncbi:MAG: hypothetical protein M1833_006353 [Piccolia ochrophora]|nr:MAG: hypothetical protein M1833_006353 [Piccolia ochrophora]